MSDTVTISKKRYEELLKDEATLAALDEMGVDNWCGYDEAMRILKEDDNDGDA